MHYLVYYGIVSTLILGSCQAIQAQQGKNSPQQESARAQQRVSPPIAPVASPSENANVKQPESPIQSPEGREDKSAAGNQAVTRAEWIQIGINAFLFIVVLCQTVIYIQQRNAMQAQNSHAEITERAYLGFTEFTLNPVVNDSLTITAKLGNGGRTPAWGLRTKSQATLRPEPVPTDWDRYPFPEETGNFISAGEKSNIDFVTLRGVTPPLFAAFKSGELKMFIDVQVCYWDHSGCEHTMEMGYTLDLGGGRSRTLSRYHRHKVDRPKKSDHKNKFQISD